MASTPSVAPEGFGFGVVSRLEGVEPAAGAVSAIEGFQQISDWWVVGGIAKEDELVPAKQSLNEPCGPALGQVGPSKVSAGKHEFIIIGAGIVVGDATVEMDHAV